ncbi:MAG TPA: IPT/TIG domain-containing protein [Acidimicrobiales bacterium]|nr:IPT/TIG domain-containing protein [Acidimicrobiales bacterium]
MQWRTRFHSRALRRGAIAGALALIGVALPALPPAGAAPDVSEYPVPSASGSPKAGAPGPDGNMWFTESGASKVARITPAGAITEFATPTPSSGPAFITAGPDGNMWFSEYDANKVARLKPSDGSIVEFDVPTAGGGPYGITAGPDGNVWFAEANEAGRMVARITPAGVITEYPTGDVTCAPPYDIAAGPDGNLWFTTNGCGFFGGTIGKVTTAGVVSLVHYTQYRGDPVQIDAGSDGALWFAETDASAIGRITTDGVVTEYPTPTPNANPWGLAKGPDGNVWFTENNAGQLGRITPDGVIDEFSLPTSGSQPLGMAKGTTDGRVWFAENGANQVGAIATTAAPLPGVHAISPNQGPVTGGTSVTISGTGFTGATAVKFGTTAASSFSVDDDGQITAQAPALPGGYYDVTVATPTRTTPTVPGGRYLSLAPLKITVLSPKEGDPDGGSKISIFGSGFASASAVAFGGTPASDFSVNNDTQITATVPPQPDHTVIHVMVTNVAGASPTTSADLFTYLARPVIDSMSPQWATSAGGTTVTLHGKRFTGVTAVRFGTTAVSCPAQCQVVADDTLEVITPPHAVEAVPVSVTSPDDGPSLSGPMFAFTGDGAYTPTGSCAPACASGGAALLPDGTVLGFFSGQYPDLTPRANIWDPRTGVWTPKSSCDGCGRVNSMLLLPKGPSAACGANCGKALLFPGAKLYDPATDTWSATSPAPVAPFANDPVLLQNGKVLVVDGPTAAVWDPAADTWTSTPPMAWNHNSGTTTLLDNGKVLVAGGGGAGAPARPPRVNAAELYDPASNTWALTGPLAQGRLAHDAVKMPNGKVLLTGGTINFYVATAQSEIYDPATGQWGAAPNTIFARNSHDGTLLPDGRVLLSGGDEPFVSCDCNEGRVGNVPSIGELYDPAAQTWTPTGPSGLQLQDRGQNNQQHTARAVLLPPGPASACGTHCGQVLTIRGADDGYNTIVRTPSAVLFAPAPKATLAGPSTGSPDGGTRVTITGTGLASVSAVSFGGFPAASVTPDPATPDTKLVAVSPAHLAGPVDVAVTAAGGATIAGRFTFQVAPVAASVSTGPVTTLAGIPGYALVGANGSVFSFGGLPDLGSLVGSHPVQDVVAIEHTATGKGYWLAGADGGVFAFGDAPFLGSMGGTRLTKPIVGMASTPTGKGYWLVASDGGVFAFGDAVFRGSTGAMRLNSPVVGAARSSSGNGYWLVASDGGVFAFGDAAFRGSTGAIRLADPVVAMARSVGGDGYLLVASDGGVFAFGDAVFHGSTGAIRLNSPIVGLAPASGGYVLCARDGGVFAFGAAPFLGSMGLAKLVSPIVACDAPRPS